MTRLLRAMALRGLLHGVLSEGRVAPRMAALVAVVLVTQLVPLGLDVDAPGVGARPAGAICQEYWWSGYMDVGWAREEARYGSTCDHDNFYAGRVLDTLTDGSCVDVQYRDPYPYLSGFMGRSCGSWAQYNWRDGNGDNGADIRMHRSGQTTSYSNFAPTTGY